MNWESVRNRVKIDMIVDRRMRYFKDWEHFRSVGLYVRVQVA